MTTLIETYNLTGIIIGAATFLLIGLFHPVVIKAEYYFGTRCWWVFLLMGIAALAGSILLANVILSSVCAVLAFTAFWSIGELFEQKKRVAKGWFPRNPNKDKK